MKMKNKMLKFLFSFGMAVGLLASASIVSFAATPTNSVDGGQGPGTGKSTNEYVQNGDKIEVGITNRKGTYRQGEENLRPDGKTNYNNNPTNKGPSMNDMLLNAGCDQASIDAFKAAKGYYQDRQGLWRRADGGLVDWVSIEEIMSGEYDDSSTSTSTPLSTPGTPPPVPSGWQIDVDENKKTLMSGDMTGGAMESQDDPYHECYDATEIGTVFDEYSFSLPGGSAEYLFNASGRTKGAVSWQEPEWTYMQCTLQGQWVEVNHRRFKKWHAPWDEAVDTDGDGVDDSTVHHDGYWEYSRDYYTIVGYPTASASLSYAWTPLKPEYTERLPLSLTTESGYSGGVSIVDTHGWPFTAPSSTGGTVNCKVEKENMEPGEMLSMIANNNPVKFTYDFKDTWYGFDSSENLLGPIGPVNSYGHGFQWVNMVTFFMGPDYQSDSRNPKLNSITAPDSPTSEKTGKVSYYVNSGGGIGAWNLYMRNIQENPVGDPYLMGESGNNCWWSVGRLDRNNLKGVDWSATWEASPSISAGIDQQDYTKLLIYDYFKQPVLYGEYDSSNAAGR